MSINFDRLSRVVDKGLVESLTWYYYGNRGFLECGVVFWEEPKESRFLKAINLKYED